MTIVLNLSTARKLFLGLLLIPFCVANAPAGLTHRYSFNDNAAVKDSVGKIDGKLQGGATVTDGKLVLKNDNKNSGDNGVQFVEFCAAHPAR